MSSDERSEVVSLIASEFGAYTSEFRRITRRAAHRFELCDWKSMQRDTVQRVELYDSHVNDVVARLKARHGAVCHREAWRRIRDDFAARSELMPDSAFAQTFFSSIARRLFGVVGVEPELEFPAGAASQSAAAELADVRRYTNRGSLRMLLEEVLGSPRFRSQWQDFQHSLAHVLGNVKTALRNVPAGAQRTVEFIEVIPTLFYQRTRAYLVARIHGRDFTLPLVIAFSNHPDLGIAVDAVLVDEDDVSIVFGYTRSYFHADLPDVGAAVRFLRSMLPRKPVSELFTILGRLRQGKAERFRELMQHLANSDDKFAHAPGERGLVMICFTLPSYNVVFKVIRDRIPYPKTVSRTDVMDKYRFVFRHDRAGRLVDAQEYRRMRLPVDRLDPALIDDLANEAASTVHVAGPHIVFEHVYVERRMTPLNLYLTAADSKLAAAAVRDYGQCLRDLAHCDVFPGDLLLKNFGVTRNGRVIFYDYDELCTVSECRFRDIPQPSDDDDEMRAEPSFYIGEHDVFPETFLPFLSFSAEQREIFLNSHAELLRSQFWRDVQEKLAHEEVLEILPYQRRAEIAADT